MADAHRRAAPPAHHASPPPPRTRGPLEALAARLADTQLGGAGSAPSHTPPPPLRREKPLPDVPPQQGCAPYPQAYGPLQQPQWRPQASPAAQHAPQHRRAEDATRWDPHAAPAPQPYAQHGQQAQAGPSRLAPLAAAHRGPLPRAPAGSVWAHASQLVAARPQFNEHGPQRPQPSAPTSSASQLPFSTSSASLPASLRAAQTPPVPLPRPPSISSADVAYGSLRHPNPWESSLLALHPSTGRPVSLPSTPVRAPAPPTRPRSVSPSPPPTRAARSPPGRGSASPAPAGGATQRCAGIRKDGVRCARRVRVERAATRTPSPRKRTPSPTKATRREVIVISDDDEAAASGDEEDVFCSQHVKEINKTGGMHLPSSRGFLAFDALLVGLSQATAARIRALLGRPLTAADAGERGYLYIYSLRALDDATHECLKVGRAKSALKRVGEWRAQCASKQPVLRAIVPSDASQSLIPGAAAPTARGIVGSHLWERLVHLELRDINAAWAVQPPCSDCGARHRELFRLPRGAGGREGGFEHALAVVRKWEAVVRRLAPD